MNRVIILFLAFGLVLSHGIVSPLAIRLAGSFYADGGYGYKLACDGASGNIIYHVDGLPSGGIVQGDSIILSGNTQAGVYNVIVRAIDGAGQITSKDVKLTVGVVDAESSVLQATAEQIQQASAIEANINTLISQHSTITQRKEVSYSDNRFPEVNFPSGGNPESFNSAPINILSRQSQTSDLNRNIITPDDVAMRTASERHQSAVKGITNLLKIIDQGRANINQAQLNIETYTVAHNEALANRKNAQTVIIAAENKISQIQSAIDGLKVLINRSGDDLNDADALNVELNIKKKEILDIIQGQEKTKAGLINTLQSTNGDLSTAVKELAQTLEKCQTLNTQVQTSTQELATVQETFDNVVQERKTAQADVATKKATVKDLRQQLTDAEDALAQAEIKLADVKAEQERLPNVIATISAKLQDLTQKAEACEKETNRIEDEIDELKNDEVIDLTNQIDNLEASILDKRQRVTEIDVQISDNTAVIQDLKAKLAKSQTDLQFLTTQIVTAQEELRIAYENGNDANTVVVHQKENIDAAVARFKSERQIVCEATLNLEKVRAEESLARLALEELIAKYSDALPYAIVPNGNGLTDTGNPNGNNPSGSPLGPTAASSGAFYISDWTHYLSNVFGAGVSPNFIGTVNELYPFNFLAGINGNRLQNRYGHLRGGCGGYGPVRAFSGSIVAVSEDYFNVKISDGSVYTVNVSPCTKFSSNVNNYRLVVGDEAVVKGSVKSGRHIEGSEAICLHK